MVVLDFLWVCDEFLVHTKKRRFVKNGEEGSPLLEVDIDASIREQAGRYPHGLRGRLRRQGVAPLNVEEGLRVKLGARLAILLDLAFKGL